MASILRRTFFVVIGLFLAVNSGMYQFLSYAKYWELKKNAAAAKHGRATAAKADLVARLRRSFEYCGTVVGSVKDSQLADSVPFFGGRKATRARAVIALAQDWADHYAQAAMYLRLNGILPPSARPKK